MLKYAYTTLLQFLLRYNFFTILKICAYNRKVINVYLRVCVFEHINRYLSFNRSTVIRLNIYLSVHPHVRPIVYLYINHRLPLCRYICLSVSTYQCSKHVLSSIFRWISNLCHQKESALSSEEPLQKNIYSNVVLDGLSSVKGYTKITEEMA